MEPPYFPEPIETLVALVTKARLRDTVNKKDAKLLEETLVRPESDRDLNASQLAATVKLFCIIFFFAFLSRVKTAPLSIPSFAIGSFAYTVTAVFLAKIVLGEEFKLDVLARATDVAFSWSMLAIVAVVLSVGSLVM